MELVLRPESIAIAGDGEGDLRAKVVSRTFLGEKTEYVFDCAGTPLASVRYNAGPKDIVPEGASVSLSVAMDGVRVLRGSER